MPALRWDREKHRKILGWHPSDLGQMAPGVVEAAESRISCMLSLKGLSCMLSLDRLASSR